MDNEQKKLVKILHFDKYIIKFEPFRVNFGLSLALQSLKNSHFMV